MKVTTRRKDNIKMYFKDTSWQTVDWINRAEERDKFRALFSMGNKVSRIAKWREFLD
jgi:hypothetical protein